MDRDDELRCIMQASFSYHEMFRNTQIKTIPDNTLTKTQMDILVSLLIGGEQNMSTISNRLNLAREQVTRAMNGLRENGYVDANRDPENRRAVLARLSPKGHELLDKHLEASKRAASEYLAPLTDDDWHELTQASFVAREILNKLGTQRVE